MVQGVEFKEVWVLGFSEREKVTDPDTLKPRNLGSRMGTEYIRTRLYTDHGMVHNDLLFPPKPLNSN